ncbi:MAG TPA: AmmeMemoRadiSam system radical SAM enzyme [Nitrospinota bacterium]|nr:AmmeMemoRadiSam system radical SAM enzyme [Nitrospinota bacterium]
MMIRRKFLLGAILAVAAFILTWFWDSFSKILGFRRLLMNQPKVNDEAQTTSTKLLKEVMFYQKLENKMVQCQTCFRMCVIPPGARGFCRVRENRDGKYYSLVYGEPSAVHVDPIEKEPQHHNLPGSHILCFGTVGCNFKCRHCHNWHLSQVSPGDFYTYDISPEKAVESALKKKVPTISFTYNEPTVFYEYVYDIAVLAKKRGLRILWHSNGSMNPEPLRKLLRVTDAATIDLKGFTKKAYQNSSADLEPVLRTLKIIKYEGKWLEIVNLVVPTINDDPKDLRRMCEWIREEIGVETPLHFSRFFPNYKLTHLDPTPIQTLEMAHGIAVDVGMNYVTIGNVPGHKLNSTFCPKCKERLIHRIHFEVLKNNVVNGRCRFCDHRIPGIWG